MRKSNYGGQALIEGLMIKGPAKTSIAVRKPDHSIEVKSVTFKTNANFKKIPCVRGVVEFFRMNVQGIRALLYSAEVAGMEETEAAPSRFEAFLSRVFGENYTRLLLYFTAAVSIFFSVFLFLLLPNIIIDLFGINSAMLNNLLEGVLKLAIFTVYMALTSRLSEMKRVWMYHGAEHKIIHCYEHEEELTVENIRKYSTKHPRCGTSFLFSVIIISILLFSLVGWHNPLINIVLRLALVPVVAGVSYELFKFLWKKEGRLVDWVNKPGILFQNFTTREPDDSQIEVAIAAFNAATSEGEAESW